MAKKSARSTAAKPNNGPENISQTLVARDNAADQPQRVQQAPGDAVAARSTNEPSDNEIRARAYEMYLERGGDHGLDLDDWVRAERELRQRR
jgi:DUF2934 family protein